MHVHSLNSGTVIEQLNSRMIKIVQCAHRPTQHHSVSTPLLIVAFHGKSYNFVGPKNFELGVLRNRGMKYLSNKAIPNSLRCFYSEKLHYGE